MNKITVGLTILALILTTGIGHAESMTASQQAAFRADWFEVMKILKPVNMHQMDKASKDMFEDFFEEKDKLYQKSIKPATKIEQDFVNPKPPQKRFRQTF